MPTPFETSKHRVGMSQIITELILIVAVVTVTVAMVSWLLGIWNTQQENFIIVPTLSVKASSLSSSPELQLYIKNTGTKPLTILLIEIEASEGTYVNRTNVTIQPHQSTTLRISNWIWEGEGNPPGLVPGGKYRVKIYTEFGTYIVDVVASG